MGASTGVIKHLHERVSLICSRPISCCTVFSIIGRRQRHCFQKRAVKYESHCRQQQPAIGRSHFGRTQRAVDQGQYSPVLGHGSVRGDTENVRGEDVFVIQSTSYPANDNLMELLVTIDALRRGRRAASRPCCPTTAMPVRTASGAAYSDLRQAGRKPDHRWPAPTGC